MLISPSGMIEADLAGTALVQAPVIKGDRRA
jgi:hypothetical protein